MAFNNLTDAQAERLALLVEEAGEVVQAAGKILRHGYHVDYKGKHYSNKEQLECELGQLLVIVEMLLKSGDINEVDLAHYGNKKLDELPRWTHYQPKELYSAVQSD